MLRSELVKFRLAPSTKATLFDVAHRKKTTVSRMLREAAVQAATGRSIDLSVRRDIAKVRRLANVVLACAEAPADVDAPLRLAEAARGLRDVAERHLGPAP